MCITSIGLARLGLSVVILSTIGGDLFGSLMTQSLKNEGIDIEYLETIEDAPSSTTLALSYAGDRAFVTHRGAEKRESLLLESLLHSGLLKKNSFLHIVLGHDPGFVRQLKIVREEYPVVYISLVVSWEGVELYREECRDFQEILTYIDFLFCNKMEVMILFGGKTI